MIAYGALAPSHHSPRSARFMSVRLDITGRQRRKERVFSALKASRRGEGPQESLSTGINAGGLVTSLVESKGSTFVLQTQRWVLFGLFNRQTNNRTDKKTLQQKTMPESGTVWYGRSGRRE